MTFNKFFILLFLIFSACSAPTQNTALTASATPTQPTIISTATALPTAQPTARPTDNPTATPFVTPTDRPTLQTPAWFNDIVLYEIFPRSFYDSNGDSIGDLKGIEQKLDYLKNLGVGALWLTPIFASPSYHGYDITDYYKINPEFGTTQALLDLVNAAHERDIKIILDFVAGHSSDQHSFFQDAFGNPNSKYANWYRWLDDAHTKYEHFGSATNMPKWNQDNPATRDYLIDAAKYWMNTADIDGYRLDYALGVSHDFWKAFRHEIKSIDPDALLLGEVWDSGLKIKPYYDNEFDASFDFPVYFDVMGSHSSAGNSALLGKRALSSFESALKAQTRLYPPGAQSVRFLSNHDTVRVMSQVNAGCKIQNAECKTQSNERAKLAATLLLTLPATPMIYYGEEIGMSGDKSDGDKTVREPMDWYATEYAQGMTTWYRPALRFNGPLDGISVEEQQGKSDSLLEHYRALIELRAKYDALRHGEFVPLAVSGNPQVAAYARVTDDETIVIILNPADQVAEVTLDLRTVASGEISAIDLLTDKKIGAAPAEKFPLALAPRSASILKLNP